MPTPPAAPLTSTRCPARTAPTSRIPRSAVAPAIGTAAACSKVRLTGLGTTLSASRARVLGERALAEAEHLVAGPQPAHVRADRLHPSGRVDPGHPGLRLGQPHFSHQPRDERVAAHDVPVVRVERGGVHPNQHVVGADLGQVGVHQPEDVRRAEPLLHDRLQSGSPRVVAPCRGDRR